jgi:hypothetical protein
VLRVGFVNFVANLVEWAAPLTDGALADGDPDGPGAALPAIESRIDPPTRLEGTVTGEPPPRNGSQPLWHWFVLLALVLVTIEWLLPFFVGRRRGAGGEAT